jgi:hypothetical protein
MTGYTVNQLGIVRIHLMHRLKQYLKSVTKRNIDKYLSAWLEEIDNQSHAVIGQAIVVGGRCAENIVIENNDIHSCAQGIHIGLSHSTKMRDKANADVVGRVALRQNNLKCVLCPGAPLDRHGIFVGNANSVVIRDNHISLKRLPGVRHLENYGIKLFGFLGEFAQISNNHFIGFGQQTISITARGPISNDENKLWIVNDNFPDAGKWYSDNGHKVRFDIVE